MSAQLEHAYTPEVGPQAPPAAQATLIRLPSAKAAHRERRQVVDSTDRDRGLGLLFRFIISTSVVVAVVMLAVAVDRMWILVPAMAMHLAVTYWVLHGIFLLVNDGYESDVPDAR